MTKKSGAGVFHSTPKHPVPDAAGRELPVALEWLVALGLAVVMLMRPIWDGSVYEYSNIWFLYGISALFAVWAVALMMAGATLRFTRHLALFGVFLAVVALLSVNTIQSDQTYRALMLWLSYLLLFVLASNALRSRAAVAVVLGSFVIASFGEVIFSWVHYEYILPYIRRQILEHPTLLMSYFGATSLTPELASRLNANRAFGSFLFANALAAYLVLGIPYFIGELVNSFGRFRGLRRERAEDEASGSPYSGKRAVALGIGLLVWLVLFCVFFVLYPQLYEFVKGGSDWQVDTGTMIWIVGVLPIALGAVPALFVGLLGRKKGWYAFQSVFLAVLVCLATYILWLTFSRGGALALVVASAAGLCLLWWAQRRPAAGHSDWTRSAAASAGIVLVMASAFAGMSHAGAQAVAPQPAVQAPAAPAPAVPPVPVNPARPVDPNAPKLVEEGVDLKLSDLSNPATLQMRSAYWRIGLRMGLAHFWTGAGLGTFQTAYARHQDLNAPPVKAAHNDYVQIFAETGVFGLLLFVGFWAFFLVWGLRQILREQNKGTRWVLTGLLVGILSFLLHSVVDFNFYNPSLAMTQFLLAGLFLSRSGADDPIAMKRLPQHIALVVLLAFAGLASATGLRMQVAHGIVGEDPQVNARFAITEPLVALDPKTYRASNQVRMAYADFELLIPDRKTIESFGVIYVPVAEDSMQFRVVEAAAPITPKELERALVLVRDPAAAKKAASEGIQRRIEGLERAHKIYPHDPQVPAELFRWSEFLRQRVQDTPAEREHVMTMLKWSEECARLSPETATFRGYHGNALLRRGRLEKDPKRAIEFYRGAIEEYRNATERWPSSDAIWNEYSSVTSRYGQAFIKYGLKDEGEGYMQESRRAAEAVKQIQAKKKP